MTPRDFAYWLQGFFELNGTEDELTYDQRELIIRHADLALLNNQGNYFVSSVRHLVDSDVDTEIIKHNVGLYFQHVIDPTIPNINQAKKIHSAGASDKPKLEALC